MYYCIYNLTFKIANEQDSNTVKQSVSYKKYYGVVSVRAEETTVRREVREVPRP